MRLSTFRGNGTDTTDEYFLSASETSLTDKVDNKYWMFLVELYFLNA